MRTIATALSSIFFLGCSTMTPGIQFLRGTWKSDAAKTLDSMNQVKGIPSETRSYLENDFFGHLVVEYRGLESRALDTKENYDSGFTPFEVLHESSDEIRIKKDDPSLGEIEWAIYPDGDCYYVITSAYEFREYFCKIQK